MGFNLLPNQIICGDNVEILNTFPDDVIDLTVTSPPYDDMRKYEGYSFDFETLAKELYRVTKPGGRLIWVVADQTKDHDKSGTSFTQALYFKRIGFKLNDNIIYEKPPKPTGTSHIQYYQVTENMFVLSKGTPNTTNLIKDRRNKLPTRIRSACRDKTGKIHYRSAEKGKYYNPNLVRPVEKNPSLSRRINIWRYVVGGGHVSKDKFAHKHPAIFPEKLAADHIKSWSNKGDLILDPFCGSGTTLKMAKLLWRDYIGIDVSQKYCDVSKQRVSQEPIL